MFKGELGIIVRVIQESPMKKILMQMPTQGTLSEADFNQMRDTMERQSRRRLQDVQTIEDKAGRIVTQEGVNSEGIAYRQMMVTFQGNNGLAFMSVSGPVEEWDQAEFDQMVGSIKKNVAIIGFQRGKEKAVLIGWQSCR